MDAKDRYTSGHSKRVAEYALMIAARMGKSSEEQAKIYRANRHISIDCGCTFGGKLAALCLETGEEFYV